MDQLGEKRKNFLDMFILAIGKDKEEAIRLSAELLANPIHLDPRALSEPDVALKIEEVGGKICAADATKGYRYEVGLMALRLVNAKRTNDAAFSRFYAALEKLLDKKQRARFRIVIGQLA